MKKQKPLTKAQMRVAIAEDVIKQINDRERPLVVMTGSYIRMCDDEVILAGTLKAEDLGEIVDDIQTHCHVCALGAALLSRARLFDEVPAQGIVGERQVYDRDKGEFQMTVAVAAGLDVVENGLKGIFTPLQMQKIESAFECADLSSLPVGRVQKYIEFGLMHRDPGTRLAAIMANIVKNKGEFKP